MDERNPEKRLRFASLKNPSKLQSRSLVFRNKVTESSCCSQELLCQSLLVCDYFKRQRSRKGQATAESSSDRTGGQICTKLMAVTVMVTDGAGVHSTWLKPWAPGHFYRQQSCLCFLASGSPFVTLS